ncbi:acetylornithine deacetylase/succinyl-diaminopimelate desuccinylase-like protein [Arthrobacter sp. CAN_A212]|uniref:peptidase dimerization domain-containing protein n=1 Tax=Arthrobacter sp. CAN_A212 TaxID=2787719 RepID=UPI0018CAEF4D
MRGESELVFEASAHGALKAARKGVGIFQVQARGEEAHAGLDPDAGVSAVDEIARLVLELHGAADLDAGTTPNVGLLKGGTRANVKAGRATANIDVRVSSDEEAERIDGVLAGLTPHNAKACEVTGGWNRPVMVRSEDIASLIGKALAVAGELGFRWRIPRSAVPVTATSRQPSACRCGWSGCCRRRRARPRTEWISIDGMLERTCLAAGLLAGLSAAAKEPVASAQGGRN